MPNKKVYPPVNSLNWRLRMRESIDSNPIPETTYLSGPTGELAEEHVQSILILVNDNSSAINFTMTRDILEVGESVEIIRGDLGEVNLIAPAGTLWLPTPAGPAYEIATVQKSVKITRLLNTIAPEVHAYYIRGDYAEPTP